MSNHHAVAAYRRRPGPWLVRLVVQVGTVLVFAAGLAVAVRSACLDPGPPVSLPEPGTPRAGYCDTVRGGTLWVLLVGIPVALAAMAGATPAGRRRPLLGWVVVGVIVVALWVDTLYVGSLDFAYTA